MHARSYVELLGHARRAALRADEAEDLLQAVLLAAIEAGRADLARPDNRRWLIGALRKRALFEARSAARRRRRDAAFSVAASAPDQTEAPPARFVDALPPGLRLTALLALTGHTRAEIAWLLGLSDPALRQRIAEIRRRWRRDGGRDVAGIPGLNGPLAFGRIRRSLLAPVRRPGAVLASHDPDGHLFVVTSRNAAARQHGEGPTPDKERNRVRQDQDHEHLLLRL